MGCGAHEIIVLGRVRCQDVLFHNTSLTFKSKINNKINKAHEVQYQAKAGKDFSTPVYVQQNFPTLLANAEHYMYILLTVTGLANSKYKTNDWVAHTGAN